MAGQQFYIWTGGQAHAAAECLPLAEALPWLPDPTPLRRAAHISYQWGDMRFDIWATACSVRTTPWGGALMTWLHCKAMNTVEIRPEEPTRLMTVLIPAAYVTSIRPGPTFRLTQSQLSADLGVFPPNRPDPAASLPLAEVEHILAGLLAPERN
jgi:hypothetical protein